MKTTQLVLNEENNTMCVQGELTLETIDPLFDYSKKLLAPHLVIEKKELVIDLERVTHADSAGLALLCEWKRWHPNVVYKHLSDQLKSVAIVHGLEKVL
jgi:ABC-type transporter Mla MlaB component